ncbi:MAG TPA: crotonase/enoyl-CoA hydratase family protein [Acidimicrobiia bacterium]|nr:crotonase/enoyl-CoA hydratase family protein [Acidimicrobiia bacterium]
MSDALIAERRDRVLVLRLNRPEARNALNAEIIGGLGAQLEAADRDPDVRAMIITGTGDRAFCAGMDLREFAERDRSGGDRSGSEYLHFLQGGIEKPVIGAANATAVAGGFELLLACDLVVASEAARFGLPEVQRGLFPAGGGVLLGRRLPLAVALELGLTGDTIDAPRALALGLVNRVVPPDRVLDEALALADRIAANGPLAVRATKQLMRDALDASRDEIWARQTEVAQMVFGSEDAREGARAFVEKRPPNWSGR